MCVARGTVFFKCLPQRTFVCHLYEGGERGEELSCTEFCSQTFYREAEEMSDKS